MELKKFEELIELKNMSVIKVSGIKKENKNHCQIFDLYNNIRNLKKILSYIDFQCNFENGKCKNYKNHKSSDDPKCCCLSCSNSLGYFQFIPEHLIKYYAKLFTKTNGFWKKDKGCKIKDVRNRSIICLCYNCSDSKDFYYAFNNYKEVIIGLINNLKNLTNEE